MERRQYSFEKLTPEQATTKARQFIIGLGETVAEKVQSLKTRYPVQEYRHFDGDTEERVSYISSHRWGEARGKPTVIILSGVFQEVREWPLELATIANVFGVQTIAVDYAALASRGMDHMLRQLPRMLELFEVERNPSPPRILIGESLGGIIAQSIAFAGPPETNVKGMVLSHTIPPDKLNKSLVRFLRGLALAAPIVPMQVARRVIDRFITRAESQCYTDGEVEQLSRELSEVGRILRGENGALTKRRATGFLNATVGAVDKSRNAPQTVMCVEVIASPEDQVVGYADQEEWRRYHRGANLTSLSGTEGHYKPGLRKEKVLVETLIPLLTKVLAAAAT